MGLKALHLLLWLLTVLTLTTQELARLKVSPRVPAECGKRVTLHCNVPSRNGLLVQHMQWFQNRTSLCSVNDKGILTTHQGDYRSYFHCEYEHGQLSLVFHKVQPMDIGNKFMCKLRSNRGAVHDYSTVELQECYGNVTGSLEGESNNPTCIFEHVYPDGDVHWFHGSTNYSSRPEQKTSKGVDRGGWLTIHSSLQVENLYGAFNCSLVSTTSGRYIASYLVQKPEVRRVIGGVESKGPMRTFLFISILLGVSLQ